MPRNAVDQITGEVLTEPDFVKLYIKELCRAKGIKGRQLDVFNFMLSEMNSYNEVSYGKPAKDRFLAAKCTSNATFNNSIKALIDRQLIERIAKGSFRVNKKYAVKVEWSKVQSIEWTTIYTKEGKKESILFKK